MVVGPTSLVAMCEPPVGRRCGVGPNGHGGIHIFARLHGKSDSDI